MSNNQDFLNFCYSYGVDLNGARRKNATRETTSTLKAWLNEHKKNPYPTKGEKIMLAIITKMTLTQVSTWFANARRRLKKENKMTWEPRNRVEDEDNNNEDDDSGRKSVDDKDRSLFSCTSFLWFSFTLEEVFAFLTISSSILLEEGRFSSEEDDKSFGLFFPSCCCVFMYDADNLASLLLKPWNGGCS